MVNGHECLYIFALLHSWPKINLRILPEGSLFFSLLTNHVHIAEKSVTRTHRKKCVGA